MGKIRLAVTYDNGMVGMHFGKAEAFKIYDISDGVVTGSTVIDVKEEGHEAVCSLLTAEAVDVVICSHLGEGAQQALADAGIIFFSGADGEADTVVEEFLTGVLTSSNDGSCNCSDGGCGGDCGSGCGSGCGGCGGGCGGAPSIEGKNVGKTCRTHYRGTFNDGTQFDSSYDRGEPLEFICGAGMMIRGFDAAVANMEVGEKVDVHLMPEDAYGMPDPSAIFKFEIANLPGAEDLSVGEKVYMSNSYGQQFPVTVLEKDDTTITLDANHEMAGKELNFTIELVEVL